MPKVPLGSELVVTAGGVTGTMPLPFALVSTHVSFRGGPESGTPPKTIMRFEAASYTPVCSPRAAGSVPVTESWVQAAVPVKPLALDSTQTSLSEPALRHGD